MKAEAKVAILERDISREQAAELFKLPNDGVFFYKLKLVPSSASKVDKPNISPFATELEAEQFTKTLSRKLISATR